MKRIAVTGGKGMLGRDIATLASKRGFETKVYDLPEHDITCENILRSIVQDNDIVVNCAAYTQVDSAESDAQACMAINCDTPGRLGELARDADKYVLHISTDFVFGDTGESPLGELTPPCPLSVYGKSKLEGELLLAASGCRHSTVRTQWTYAEHGKNFVNKIIQLAAEKDTLKVVDDQFGAPTPTALVASAVMCLVATEQQGLFHFAAAGFASRFEVAETIVQTLGLDTDLRPCSSTDFRAPATRPLNTRLECSKIEKLLDFKRPQWKDCLLDFLRKDQTS